MLDKSLIETFVTSLLQAATAFMLYKSLRLSKDSKKVDILVSVTNRYVELWDRMEAARTNPQAPAERLYEKFWSLQREQFRYWRLGFIDVIDYRFWLKSRHEEQQKLKPIQDVSYRDGANAAIKDIGDPDFSHFMDLVFRGEIDQALTKYKP